MNGKIIIYGGSGGIGSALARKATAAGTLVHLAGRNQETLATLAQEIGAEYSLGDVVDPTFFPRVMEDAGDQIDGVVYAVGTINLRGFPRLEPEDYLHDFQVNALGAALAVRAAVKALKKSEAGSVVLLSSVAAHNGFGFHASMGMAKAAVSGLTLSLAAELAPRIRVNAIAPSLVESALTEKMLAHEKTRDAIAALHPLKRLGTAEDIASLAAFLLSPASSWMTGQIIGVDGGRANIAAS